MITRRLLWRAAILSTGPSPGYSAPSLQVVSSDDQGMVVELRLPRPTLVHAEVSGQSYDDLEMSGSCRLSARGQPVLPFFAELIAAPPGSRLQVTAEALSHVDLEGVRFVPAIADSAEDGGVVDTRLTVTRSDSRGALAERALPELAAGATFVVRFDSLSLPPVGIDLVARVLTARADAVPVDNERRVPLLFDGRAPIVVKLWPEGHSYIDGDLLRPRQGLIVSAPYVAGGRVTFMLDGEEAQPDLLLPADGVNAGPRVLLRPELANGTHELQARVWDGWEEVGARTIRFVISSQLALANALVYPNPIREAAAITFTLSHDATVAVDLYALSGRRVRHLETRPLPVGFAQVAWDGCDNGGNPVANGTYPFRVDVRSGDLQVESRGPLMVLR